MPAVLKCARRRGRRRKMQDAAAEIREIVDRETRAWDTQDAELLLSVFHPDMVWPWPKPPRSHDPMDWVLAWDGGTGGWSLGPPGCGAVALRVPPGHGLALAEDTSLPRSHGLGARVGPL